MIGNVVACRDDVWLLRFVIHLAGHLVQYLDVFDITGESVIGLDVAFHVGVLAVNSLGKLLVIPQVWARHLNLESRTTGPGFGRS